MAIIQNLEAFVQSYPAGLDSVTDLQLSQNENGRQIRFTIGGVTIPAGSVATISGTKPDGVVYSNTGTIEGADTVIFDEDVQMTAVFGTWYAKIRITNAGNTIASARVRFIIDKDPVDAGAIPSESQLNGLVAEAEEYAGAAEDAAERAAITYGSPLTAATASAMTDINRVYVYTGSESGYTYGNWYYYNGSAWVSGGVYNSAAVETDTTLTESGVPADAKATGDKIDELKDDLNNTVSKEQGLENVGKALVVGRTGLVGLGFAGLSDDAKEALLDCFAHVAWIDEHGEDYYYALQNALYPGSALESIIAVFTQGDAVIYPSTPLNNLKSYLVVTGNYGDGTSEPISDYTLSGTLSVGTSTITVSAERQTTTFNVVVTAPYWDYEWDAESKTVPVGKDDIPYPGSFSGDLFVIANPATSQAAYFYPIANNGAIELEIEYKIVNIYPSDWWPNFSFSKSSDFGFYVSRTGNGGYLRTTISGEEVITSTLFPSGNTVHKLKAKLSSAESSFSFDDGDITTGTGIGNSDHGFGVTGIYLVPSAVDLLGIKSVKYKYLSD